MPANMVMLSQVGKVRHEVLSLLIEQENGGEARKVGGARLDKTIGTSLDG